ncbi:MAG TPA: Yip1 family protein [Thermoanaerobaculia bacterium]|nr:Yip1 family protein [Thermoanaerobaculia bacterium]
MFARIAGVLFSPAETFDDIARRPDIIGPLLIILAIGYVTTFLVMPHLDFEALAMQQAEAMRKQNPNMGEGDVERVASMTKTWGRAMGFVGPVLGVFWYLIVAAVLLGASRAMGGAGDFKQALSTTLYAWMPLVLYGIIVTVIVMAKGMVDPSQMATVVKSNPAFLTDMKEQPILFSLLSSFDIFTIWTIILMIFGFSAFSKFSRTKSAAIVVSLWLVIIVVKLGFAALAASRA